eukprot:TRINITY_DN6067_c0_g1_i1.p1 TRINITY_DN6067_c0_g1~~TRINITY_DN6067_c0_g1_i1.p1  ORF type:complete len:449 (+),score=45.84 TRINITY_DN6067_c0_g1_i1:19-1365(+)
MPKTRRSSRASKRTVDEYEESQKPEKNVQRDAEEQDFQLNANHLDHEADSDATDDETIEREVQEGDDALIKELNELQGIGQEGDSDASSNDELLRELKEQDDETESDDEADDEDDNNTNRQSARKAPNRRKKAVKSDAAPHQDDEDEKPAKQISTKSKADAEPAPVEILTSDSDTTDDEHSTNRVGRIPMEWYHDYEHIGYGLDGKRIRKPKQKDRLQKFLDKMEGKDYSRTVYDPVTGQEIQLTDEDIEMIKRIQGGQLPDAGIDPYEDYVDFFTHEKMKTPVVSVPEPKRRFVPSKWEHKKIMKIVRSIRKVCAVSHRRILALSPCIHTHRAGSSWTSPSKKRTLCMTSGPRKIASSWLLDVRCIFQRPRPPFQPMQSLTTLQQSTSRRQRSLRRGRRPTKRTASATSYQTSIHVFAWSRATSALCRSGFNAAWTSTSAREHSACG